MKPITFLVAITTIAVILSAARANIGGWQPLKNVNNEHIREIAAFAVLTHDMKNQGRPLRLVSVERGFIQYVDGLNYKLIVSAAPLLELEGTNANFYEAIVYENFSHVKKLVSFKALLTSEDDIIEN